MPASNETSRARPFRRVLRRTSTVVTVGCAAFRSRGALQGIGLILCIAFPSIVLLPPRIAGLLD